MKALSSDEERVIARVAFPIRPLLPTIGSGAVSVVCGIGLLATSGWLITRASLRPPVFVLSIAIGAVQAFALGRGISRYLQRLSVHDLALDALGKLRVRLYDTLEPLVPGSLHANGTGSLVTGFVSDTELVTDGFVKRTSASVDVAASIVVGGCVACVVQPAMGALLVVGAMSTVVIVWGISVLGKRAAAEVAATRADLSDVVVDTFESARELLAFGRGDLVSQRLDDVRRRSTGAAVRQALCTGAARAAAIWAAGGVVVSVTVMGLLVHDAHHLSGVMLAVSVFASLAALDSCVSLPVTLADTATADAAAARLVDLTALKPQVQEPRTDLSALAVPGVARLEDAEILLETHKILQGVSFGVVPGRRVAVVGPNGTGKTTAVHALLHFVSCSRGRATLGNVDVGSMSRQGIARHVGWTDDRAHIFATSLRDNLRLARRSATDEECVEVLERVGLSSWFGSLPDGLDSELGRRATSAGERQRLGLARALIARTEVLLLDEPTAHLDPEASPQVLDEMLGAAGSRSVIVVAHSPEVVSRVDEVVTIEGGRVVSCTSKTANTSFDPAS